MSLVSIGGECEVRRAEVWGMRGIWDKELDGNMAMEV